MPHLSEVDPNWLVAWAADMLTDYFVIPEIGEVQQRQTQLTARPSLDALRAVIEPHLAGERMERVRVFVDGEYVDMFVGDRSAINGKMIRNVRATDIYHNNIRTHDPDNYDAATMPPICGPAVLFRRRVWF
ncbi:hypothetical protein QV13_24080 [Mesorhizobium hungaricum]|uniref:Uncharacterized protein n=2 Tax=Hyphomicrobiales TaxID=356 RepID=A0A1C2DD59_9HYPH|nr:hypothetical protein QV13_24080 [Mesorhizobium hungaricum]